jgi:hypothetical protein
MNIVRKVQGTVLALAVAAVVAAPAHATTLRRMSLEELVKASGSIVVGEVVDAHSYWNDEGTFILTDVRVAPVEKIQGQFGEGDLTITLMGGTVGDLTTLILGGAELVPGSSYVLFLDEADLPGARQALTVREHCQGVFEIVADQAGARAISQANGHPLVPDAQGYTDAPGGVNGFPLGALVRSLRQIAREVK